VLAFHPELDRPRQARGSNHLLDLAREHGVAVQGFLA
jgi:hypothetical protein